MQHDDGGDTREARAARRAEMRERRQLELLAESRSRGTRHAKRQRRQGPDNAEASAGTSDEEEHEGRSDIEARPSPTSASSHLSRVTLIAQEQGMPLSQHTCCTAKLLHHQAEVAAGRECT